MAYKIPGSCEGSCDNCRPQCPTGAISMVDGQLWIDPVVCNDCEGYYPEPQCVTQCPLSLPIPYQAKKGRARANLRPALSPNLFSNGQNHPFASALVIWESCNLLAQRHSLPWQKGESGKLVYQRSVRQGQGQITLQITNDHRSLTQETVETQAIATLDTLDIRAACMHLVYAAYATTVDRPWEQEFVISDGQIEEYLGLEKRKDLSKVAKLALIKEIAQQPCLITACINFPPQGRIKAFSLEHCYLWHLSAIQHHFQEDELGCKHLVGLTLRVRAGAWAKYFLNQQGCRERTALYQYGTLPKSLLTTVMSIWQQHEGAARIMLWWLFKARIGKEQRVTVPTLMRIAYGEARVNQAAVQREERKRLLRTFESDLAILQNLGLKPIFDPLTYPPAIQPLWAKLADLPEDAEAALEFWTNDGSRDSRITDAGPRGKWGLLMNARILALELPPDWRQPLKEGGKKKSTSSTSRSRRKHTQFSLSPKLSREEIVTARKKRGWSQRELAALTGKSQSWIRDVENGRFQPKVGDQSLLRKVLQLE